MKKPSLFYPDAAKFTFGQAGAGIEYRFCHNIGIFVDARCVWPDETKYYGVGRAALRVAFWTGLKGNFDVFCLGARCLK